MDGKVWSEETVEVLNDMYSVSCPVKPVFEKMKVCSLLMKNDTKCRILEQLYRENSKKRIFKNMRYKDAGRYCTDKKCRHRNYCVRCIAGELCEYCGG